MPVEKSSSTKKSTKKKETEKPVHLDAAPVKLKDEEQLTLDTIDSEAAALDQIQPGTPIDTRTEDQIRIDLLECELSELKAGIYVLMQATSKIFSLSGNGNYLKEFGLKRWEPSAKDMTRFKG